MPKSHPHLYVIAGPNGAGKTTFAREFLPRYAKCDEFVNMDLIAQGLAPFDPRTAALEAGRIMVKRLRSLMDQRHRFAFETTLAGQNHQRFFKEAQRVGYRITLYYLYLPSEGLALQRIRERVQRGGHDVPEIDVRRRFKRSLTNVLKVYRKIVDSFVLFDNAGSAPILVAHEEAGRFKVWNLPSWEKIQAQLEETHERKA